MTGSRSLAAIRLILSSVVLVGLCHWPSHVMAKAAPGPNADTQTTYEDAMSRANSGDYSGAVIQLKNVLQSDPGHLPARISLGKFLLRQGQPASAEKELRIALRLGAAQDEVLPTLGNALLMRRKFQDLLDTIKSRDPMAEGSFEVLLLRGRAHYELGQLDLAAELFAKANRKASKHPQSLVGLALVERSRGRLESSMQYIRQAIELAPEDPESWYQKAKTLSTMGESTSVLSAYDRALELNPRLLRVRIGRAAEYLNQGQLQPALEDAQFVREANPKDLMAAFIEWRAFSGLGKPAKAAEALTILGQGLTGIKEDALMREPYLLRLGAWFALARGDLARCERYLKQFVSLRPNDPNMQILLGRVNLKLDDPRAAIDILHPLAQRYPRNLAILSPLGQAYFKIGNYGEASSMFERAAALTPDENEVSANLALSRIGTGRWEEAMDGLQETVDADGLAGRAGLLLTILQFKNGERVEALETIKGLVAEQPSAGVYNLLGIVEAANGNLENAQKAFDESLKMTPHFVPAAYNLAKLDLSAGNLASANTRLETIIERDPRSSAALLGLADIALARGEPAVAVGWLEKAVSADPDDIGVRARRIKLYLQLGRNSEALNAATLLVQRKPENAVALETLGQAQVADGKDEAAKRSFRNAVHFAGFNGPQLMRIAQKQVGLGDFGEARKTLLKANQSAMVALQAAGALVRLDISLKNYEPALERIKELQEKESNTTLSHMLMGKLLLAQQRIDESIVEYEAAHKLDPSTTSMLGLFDAIDAAGRRDEAIERLEAWSAEHPDDTEARRKLALWYLPTRQLDKAKSLYESLLPGAPNDPVLLSNLARLYQLEGNSRARSLAERAVTAKPDWPVALDTLGWILVTEGEVARGLEYLREAIARSNNPLTRYHLAQALGEQGRVNEAKVELRRLLNSKRQFEWKGDVQKYYDSLAVVEELATEEATP